jgi:hypothetical protein
VTQQQQVIVPPHLQLESLFPSLSKSQHLNLYYSVITIGLTVVVALTVTFNATVTLTHDLPRFLNLSVSHSQIKAALITAPRFNDKPKLSTATPNKRPTKADSSTTIAILMQLTRTAFFTPPNPTTHSALSKSTIKWATVAARFRFIPAVLIVNLVFSAWSESGAIWRAPLQ